MKKTHIFRKPKRYKKRKGIKKNIGVFSFLRSERIKSIHHRPKRRKQDKIQHGLLNSETLLKLIKQTGWGLGEKIEKKTKNPEIVNNFLMAERNLYALYNIYKLLVNMRQLLHMLCNRMLYKKHCLINYSNNPNLNKQSNELKPIQHFSRNHLMITWKKWLGGVLTNFKPIAKRMISQVKNKTNNLKKVQHHISYPRNIPRLPAFVICTSDSHWASNETLRMRINNAQIVETSDLEMIADVHLGMSRSYYALRTFTAVIEHSSSCMRQTAKNFHRGKLLRYVIKKSKMKALWICLLRLHVKQKIRQRKRKEWTRNQAQL